MFCIFAAQLGIKPSQILALEPKLSPDDAARSYEGGLSSLLGAEGKIDVALLGMGPDGHTCSLFPGHPLLDKKNTLVASIEDSPKPPPCRITLTYKALNERTVVSAIVCSGEGKADMLADIAKGVDYPVARVANAVWFLDAPAAAKL